LLSDFFLSFFFWLRSLTFVYYLLAVTPRFSSHCSNPDWFYYKEINFWIHKKHLMNNHIRRAIPVLLKNPSFTHLDKKKALRFLVQVRVTVFWFWFSVSVSV
jgi:hypothetical protein